MLSGAIHFTGSRAFQNKAYDIVDGHFETCWNKRETVKDSHIPLDDVTVIILDVSGQAKVTDLRHMMIRQQDIPRCNVSVNTLTYGTKSNYQVKDRTTVSVCSQS